MVKPTILIADPQNLFIEGLASIIREKINLVEVVGAVSIEQVLQHLKQIQPQLIFLNYFFIQQHFNDIRPRLAENGYPEIIAICDELNDVARKLSASLGVLSVISKCCCRQDIWQQLQRFNEAHPKSQLECNSDMPLHQPHHKSAGLTTQQRKILQLLSHGLTNREISTRLGCAETTVKAHLNTAYKILGVKNRNQAMYLISQMALFPDSA